MYFQARLGHIWIRDPAEISRWIGTGMHIQVLLCTSKVKYALPPPPPPGGGGNNGLIQGKYALPPPPPPGGGGVIMGLIQGKRVQNNEKKKKIER
jgi:hypothetical protein